jgi:hypothetical protein
VSDVFNSYLPWCILSEDDLRQDSVGLKYLLKKDNAIAHGILRFFYHGTSLSNGIFSDENRRVGSHPNPPLPDSNVEIKVNVTRSLHIFIRSCPHLDGAIPPPSSCKASRRND